MCNGILYWFYFSFLWWLTISITIFYHSLIVYLWGICSRRLIYIFFRPAGLNFCPRHCFFGCTRAQARHIFLKVGCIGKLCRGIACVCVCILCYRFLFHLEPLSQLCDITHFLVLAFCDFSFAWNCEFLCFCSVYFGQGSLGRNHCQDPWCYVALTHNALVSQKVRWELRIPF